MQGVEFYRDADPTERVPGLMHVELGGYHVGDVEFVAAFDVDADKVGLDLGKAIFASINNTIKFADVPELGVLVQRGPTFDGLGKFYREVVEESPAEPVDVAQALRDARADVLVSYLPGRFRGGAALLRAGRVDAGVGFVNAIPVFIASNPEWAKKFTTRACRSSATTSRARSARRSRTACSPACSKTAASRSTTRTS